MGLKKPAEKSKSLYPDTTTSDDVLYKQIRKHLFGIEDAPEPVTPITGLGPDKPKRIPEKM